MKNFSVLVALLLFVGMAWAQDGERRPQRMRLTVEQRAQRMTEWMTDSLQLTPEQIQPVDSINLLFMKAQYVLVQAAEGDRDKIKTSLDALEQQKQLSLQAVLSSEQMDNYQKQMKNRRGNPRMREGRQGRRPAVEVAPIAE